MSRSSLAPRTALSSPRPTSTVTSTASRGGLTTRISPTTPSNWYPVAVDFETYYDDVVSITKQGTWGYTHDPKFFAYLVTIVSRDDLEYCGDPRDFDWTQLEGRILLSHNSSFDIAVKDVLVETGDIEAFTPAEWHCTASMSVFFKSGRSLKNAVKNILAMTVSKDIRKLMKGLMPMEMTELMVGPKNKLVPWDGESPTMWDMVCEYAMNDSWRCLELWEAKGEEWPEFERQLSDSTIRQSHRGFWINVPQLKKDIIHLQTVKDKAKRLLPWMNEDFDDEEGLLSVQKLGEALEAMGLTRPKTTGEDDLAFKEWEKDPKNAKGVVLTTALRTLRKSNILLKRCKVLVDRATPDGRFVYAMRYYGAGRTGRWAGGSRGGDYGGTGETGFNVHNFPRKAFEGVDLRTRVIAPKGKKLIIWDAAQIEPRVATVLTGDTVKIALIRQGMSVYVVHAIQTMGWDKTLDLKKADPNKYQLSKVRVIGLGYGCGWIKFKDFAASEYDYFMDAKTAKMQVYDFRKKERKITNMWNKLQNEFQASHGDTYQMELPSGRTLDYFDVQPLGRDWVARRELGGKFQKFYGGLLFENLVQATARDIFGNMMLNVEREYGDVNLFHCHDEGISCVDKSVSVKEFEQCIAQDYPEMPDLPVGVEAVESDFYCKP
jgi:hypothetical protein